MWDLKIDDRTVTDLGPKRVAALLAARPDLAQAPARRSGEAEWSTAAELGLTGPDAPALSEADGSAAGFAGLAKRARWLRLLCGALTPLAALTVLSNVALLGFVFRVESGGYASPLDAEAAGVALDGFRAVTGLIYFGVFLATALAYCYWINRAVRVSQEIAPDPTRVSPTWAVAWNFIPIASLWMPFRAVMQARAAATASSEPAPRLFYVWWLSWVASSVLSNASLRVGGFEPTFEQLRPIAYLDIAADAFLIVALLALRQIVRAVTDGLSRRDVAEVFA